MNNSINGQVCFVLATLCLGMGLMAGYDTLRFLRWVIPHRKGIVWLEDLLYWLIMAIPAYIVFFQYNDGAVRWYGVVDVFLGAVLYEQGVSRVLRQFGRQHLEKSKQKLIRGFGLAVKWGVSGRWKKQLLGKLHKK